MASPRSPKGRAIQVVDTSVRPDVKNRNPVVSFTWLNGELQTVTQTQGTEVVTRTLDWSAGELQSISAWEVA